MCYQQAQHAAVRPRPRSAVIAGKHNMLFSGTTVVSGSMEAVVTTTGMRTEMGRISSAIAEVEDEDTPLRKALDAFGKTLAEVIAVICLLVWVMNAGKFIDAKVKGGGGGGGGGVEYACGECWCACTVDCT